MTTQTTTDDLRRMLDEIEASDAADRDEAATLSAEIPVLARWLSRRVPTAWRRLATEITDEPGHWDSSYPPAEHIAARTRERLLLVREARTIERPTSSGFYYSYTIRTEASGLVVTRDGRLLSRTESGSGALGQYAAHPGTDSRDIRREYRDLTAPTLDDLRDAAALLRAMRAAYQSGDVAAAGGEFAADKDVRRAAEAGAARRAA
jgi:hypothetical protein